MGELADVEKHPLAQQYPCRVPVWWGRHGSVERDSEVTGVSGRLVTLRIAKNFKRYEKWLAKILRAPKELRRPLDRMNSVLWELCDGTRTFEEICVLMDSTFNERIAPVSERTTAALTRFNQLGLIGLSKSPYDGEWERGPGFDPSGELLPPDEKLNLEWID